METESWRESWRHDGGHDGGVNTLRQKRPEDTTRRHGDKKARGYGDMMETRWRHDGKMET